MNKINTLSIFDVLKQGTTFKASEPQVKAVSKKEVKEKKIRNDHTEIKIDSYAYNSDDSISDNEEEEGILHSELTIPNNENEKKHFNVKRQKVRNLQNFT